MKKAGKKEASPHQLIVQLSAMLANNPLPAVLASLKQACIHRAKDTLNDNKTRNDQGDSVVDLLSFSERIGRLEDSAGLKNDQTRDAYIKTGARKPSRAWTEEDRFAKGVKADDAEEFEDED